MEFIRQNIIWVMLAVVSGTMLLSSMLRNRGGGGVSPLEATLMINRQDAWVLDVREAPAFASGHIPGARHVPAAELKDRLGELDKFRKKPVVVVCQRGSDAKKACDTLQGAGFDKVVKLAGGMAAWEDASQPVTTK